MCILQILGIYVIREVITSAPLLQELMAQGKGDNSQKFDEVDMDDLEDVSLYGRYKWHPLSKSF